MTNQATIDQVNPQNHPGKDVYAVIGNPIAHSKSPIIHAFFAKQTNQAIHYGRIFSELNAFKETANQFFADGGKGLNVTVPFKLEAYELAQKKTTRAELAKAANVLWLKDGQLWCDNTDGIGLTRDLQRLLKSQQSSLNNAKVLILGAGGAAQGVIDPLMTEKVSQITIANRTFEKAQQLVEQFREAAASAQVNLQAIDIQKLGEVKNEANDSFDLIINATATGLGDTSPISQEQLKAISSTKTLAYDMVYGKDTRFMRDANDSGLKASDGLGMLVEQAAVAFETWRDLDDSQTNLDIDGAIAAVRATY
jgi:shikimate dehydrogenase